MAGPNRSNSSYGGRTTYGSTSMTVNGRESNKPSRSTSSDAASKGKSGQPGTSQTKSKNQANGVKVLNAWDGRGVSAAQGLGKSGQNPPKQRPSGVRVLSYGEKDQSRLPQENKPSKLRGATGSYFPVVAKKDQSRLPQENKPSKLKDATGSYFPPPKQVSPMAFQGRNAFTPQVNLIKSNGVVVSGAGLKDQYDKFILSRIRPAYDPAILGPDYGVGNVGNTEGPETRPDPGDYTPVSQRGLFNDLKNGNLDKYRQIPVIGQIINSFENIQKNTSLDEMAKNIATDSILNTYGPNAQIAIDKMNTVINGNEKQRDDVFKGGLGAIGGAIGGLPGAVIGSVLGQVYEGVKNNPINLGLPSFSNAGNIGTNPDRMRTETQFSNSENNRSSFSGDGSLISNSNSNSNSNSGDSSNSNSEDYFFKRRKKPSSGNFTPDFNSLYEKVDFDKFVQPFGSLSQIVDKSNENKSGLIGDFLSDQSKNATGTYFNPKTIGSNSKTSANYTPPSKNKSVFDALFDPAYNPFNSEYWKGASVSIVIILAAVVLIVFGLYSLINSSKTEITVKNAKS